MNIWYGDSVTFAHACNHTSTTNGSQLSHGEVIISFPFFNPFPVGIPRSEIMAFLWCIGSLLACPGSR